MDEPKRTVNISVSTPPQIDDQFLSAMGLDGLTEEQKQDALATILKTLDMRVSERVAEILNEDQLNQINELMDKEAGEEELSHWLSQNVPNYQTVIEEEAQKMRDEAHADVTKVMEERKQQDV